MTSFDLSESVKLLSLVQLFWDPMDCRLLCPWDSPGKNTGVGWHSLQGSSQPRDQTRVSCITGRFFTIWAIREALNYLLKPHLQIQSHSRLGLQCMDLRGTQSVHSTPPPPDSVLIEWAPASPLGKLPSPSTDIWDYKLETHVLDSVFTNILFSAQFLNKFKLAVSI